MRSERLIARREFSAMNKHEALRLSKYLEVEDLFKESGLVSPMISDIYSLKNSNRNNILISTRDS